MFFLDQVAESKEIIIPTYIENWPLSLYDTSVRSLGFPLSEKEALVLGSCIIDWGEAFDLKGMSPEEHRAIREQLIAKLDDLLAGFSTGAFVRLGSRSPKDAWIFDATDDLKRGLVRTGQEAFTRLTAGSERIYQDLHQALQEGYEPWVWVREWVELEPWQEFRCFSAEGKLLGASQYDYRAGRIEEIVNNQASILQAIREFHQKVFVPACHMDPVVFDVFVKPSSDGGYEVRLLEINPFYWLTDPCLFDWQKFESFQGQLLFCTEEKVPRPLIDPDEEI